MASASTMPATEAMVTVKVNFDGQTKRCKLPLRDMGASTLEDKLRAFFQIPSTRILKFERYSDSAGMYVVLDRSNISVYKQLYRAAKAKSKLKIRITDLTPGPTEEEAPKATPQPVTVEDEPEHAEKSSTTSSPSPLSQPEQNDEPKPVKHNLDYLRMLRELEDRYKEPLEADLAKLTLERQGLEQEVNRQLNHLSQFTSRLYQTPRAQAEAQASAPSAWREYRVCCNHCEQTIPDAHYHCTKCDDDDFDLCLTCVDSGVTCYGSDHWLIKRFKRNGVFVTSTTEKIPPKPKVKEVTPPCVFRKIAEPAPAQQIPVRVFPSEPLPAYTRTCNCCVQELPESHFLHCTTCEDFDLCTNCFAKDTHGHHPKHGFVPAVEGTSMPAYIQSKLSPGRNQSHAAICDGCEKYVKGVRHKCLDCPDWDYCESCIANAKIVHPGHRFVPVYEPLKDACIRGPYSRAVHVGICCDGPLCASRSIQGYITGIRYKCAVCHDTDFCANCEASPANTHNKTHPLIKFKTPVRHVTVSTCGERGNGTAMPTMGDRYAPRSTSSRATETVSRQVSMNSVQTVVDVEPTEIAQPVTEKELEIKEEAKESEAAIKEEYEEEVEPEIEVKDEAEKVPSAGDLAAIYVRDTVTDGTVLQPNHVFEQTWVLRNTGKVAWPAGCAVKFVGGDYMGHVDSNHPAGISELVSASESTRCYEALEPGKEYPFTVLLRTPSREGKIISYWRLTTDDGVKFGHRLWCDVTVQAPKVKEEVVVEKEPSPVPTATSSQMIFPKLEKESPVSSIHEAAKSAPSEPSTAQEPEEGADDDFDDCQEWDGSDDGFMTDEEYDILDASDEEYLEEQQKKLLKK